MKPEDIYSYECCPVCGHNEFYSCEAYIGGDEADGKVCLEIEPSKSKLITIKGPYYSLPSYWAACPNCNYLITKINIQKLKKAIEYWLQSEPIDNTLESDCLHCNSKNTLLWKFVSKNIEEFKIRFNWARSFNYSFMLGAIIPLGHESNVCFDCGMVSIFSSYGSLEENAHKRYLKKWPFK